MSSKITTQSLAIRISAWAKVQKLAVKNHFDAAAHKRYSDRVIATTARDWGIAKKQAQPLGNAAQGYPDLAPFF